MTQSLVRSDYDQSFDLLRRVIYELQGAKDLQTLIEVVSTYVQNHLGYELVWIGLYDSGAESLEGPWLHLSEPKGNEVALPVLPGDLFDQVLLTRRSATVPSLQDEGRVGPWQGLAKKLKVQGAILETIRYQRESLGLLLIGTSRWGVNPRQDESDQFAILASTLGATLKFLKSQTSSLTGVSVTANPLDQSLKNLLQKISQTMVWDDQLMLIVNELAQTHPDYISGLYLLDPDTGDFVTYHISGHEDKRAARTKVRTHTLPFHQNLSFFQTLERQQSVGVGDVGSSFGISVPASLVKFLNVRALLLQAVMVEGIPKGFLCLGHGTPINWSDSDKEILSSLSNFVSLTYPVIASVSASVDPSGDMQTRSTGCALPSSQLDPEEWHRSFKQWFHALTKQFQCHWSMLLVYDDALQGYVPTYYFCSNRRSKFDASSTFSALSEVDEKLLTRNEGAIAFNNLKEDLRLVAWHDVLFAHNIQSVLVQRVSQGTDLKEILLLGNTTPRVWTSDEANDFDALIGKLRQVRQHRQTHLNMLQETRLNQVFRRGLQVLQTSKSTQIFVEKAAQILMDLFEVKSCGILLWPPQRSYAKVKAFVTLNSDQFSAEIGAKVELSDDFIQRLSAPAKSKQAILKSVLIPSHGLSEETHTWLVTQDHWSIIGLPLQPQPQQPVFGVVFLAQPTPFSWTAKENETLSDFVRHMAWVICTCHVKNAWQQDYEALHTAHWYQNKILMADAETSTESTELIPAMELTFESITLVRLLRELLDQLEPVFASRQIWVQVHHLKQSNLALKSSKLQLMSVLDEVLRAAVSRSDVGGRIDIWCQMSHPEWLNLSITDNGLLSSSVIRDLQLGHHRDRLRPSMIDDDLGHRLLACKSVTQLLGGKLDFQTLDDGRILTRFQLPCITS